MFLTGLSHVKEPSHKRLFQFDIPDSDFVRVELKKDDGVKLPMEKYPAVGKYVAFKLARPVGQHSTEIVIRTELVTDEFLDELKMHRAQAKHPHKISALESMYQTALDHKDSALGLYAIYSRVHGDRYKLISIQVPGTNADGEVLDDATIVATPKGNLQLFSAAPEPGKTSVIELNTKHIN